MSLPHRRKENSERDKAVIREMKEADIGDVLRIEGDLFGDPWPEWVFRQEVDLKISYPFVVLIENEIAGYVILHHNDNYGHMTNLAVARKYQRKSIAKKLLSFILELAVDKNLAYLALEVRLSNKPAISLYESFGFTHLTVEKEYYQDPVEDCLVMVKYLDRQYSV